MIEIKHRTFVKEDFIDFLKTMNKLDFSFTEEFSFSFVKGFNESFEDISREICLLSNLKKIEIINCGLKDEAAIKITKSLLTLQSLEEINLKNNKLTFAFVDEFNHEIINNSSIIKRISLSGNEFGYADDCEFRIRNIENNRFQLYFFGKSYFLYELNNESFFIKRYDSFDEDEEKETLVVHELGSDDCAVYFQDSTSIKDFMTEEDFGDKVYEMLDKGKCAILALGLSKLNYKWKEIAIKVLEQHRIKIAKKIILKGEAYQLDTLNYLNKNFQFELEIEEESVQKKYNILKSNFNEQNEQENDFLKEEYDLSDESDSSSS